jgi:ribonucleoside-diphosphate reductase alpha chain
MAKPLEREGALAGFTYKIKWPGSDHAMYITINDIERDGRHRPFEVFINSKNLEHYAWTVALTRMISAIFRRGGDVAFVVDELKAVFDPQGGQWMGGATCRACWPPSARLSRPTCSAPDSLFRTSAL